LAEKKGGKSAEASDWKECIGEKEWGPLKPCMGCCVYEKSNDIKEGPHCSLGGGDFLIQGIKEKAKGEKTRNPRGRGGGPPRVAFFERAIGRP